MEMRVMELLPDQMHRQDCYCLNAVRATDALSFLFGCSQVIGALGEFVNGFEADKRILSLLKALCRMNLCHNSTSTRPRLYYEHSYFPLSGARVREQNLEAFIPFLSALVFLLNDDWLQWTLASDLNGESHELRPKGVTTAAVHMARQLLALGFFREQTSASSHKQIDLININGWEFSNTSAFPLVAEFFCKPLSLQQLARIAIRFLIGTNDFERRMQSLPLPTCLLNYVRRADEMLCDYMVESAN